MIKFKFNKIVKFLLLSDLIFWSGWGLISPIFAIFVVERIQGGDGFVVGISTAIYAAISSFLRVPMGLFLDNQPSEKTDHLFATAGLVIVSCVSFCFLFASVPWHVYILQAIQAVGMSMNLSGWSAMFTRHIDKGREATEWGISATSVGIGAAVSAIVGGWIVTHYGFKSIFILVGILGLIGAATLWAVRKELGRSSGHGLYFSFKELVQKGNEGRT